MADLHLRADTEIELASALPMFRGLLPHGGPHAPPVEGWLAGSPFHMLATGFPVVETDAVLDEAGETVTPATIATGFHANLRLSPRHPAYDEILAAAAPFLVSPATPALVFDGPAEWGVPQGCTRLGLKRALVELGEWDEVRALLEADPALWEEWQLATELRRSDPLVQGVIAARGYPPDRVDRLILRAIALVA